MAGDQTLFHRMDIVEAGWQVVEPILDGWAADTTAPIPAYSPQSWGPPESDLLLEQEGRAWRP
jgi:glucose-6-phosphate 1-dehydrogenase